MWKFLNAFKSSSEEKNPFEEIIPLNEDFEDIAQRAKEKKYQIGLDSAAAQTQREETEMLDRVTTGIATQVAKSIGLPKSKTSEGGETQVSKFIDEDTMIVLPAHQAYSQIFSNICSVDGEIDISQILGLQKNKKIEAIELLLTFPIHIKNGDSHIEISPHERITIFGIIGTLHEFLSTPHLLHQNEIVR